MKERTKHVRDARGELEKMMRLWEIEGGEVNSRAAEIARLVLAAANPFSYMNRAQVSLAANCILAKARQRTDVHVAAMEVATFMHTCR